MQLEVKRNKFTDEEIQFIIIKKLDILLLDEKNLKKKTIMDILRDIRDELDRYC